MNRKIPYFVKLDFNYESIEQLNLLEQKIEHKYWIELGKRCFLEKYASEPPYKYCNKINRIFGFK